MPDADIFLWYQIIEFGTNFFYGVGKKGAKGDDDFVVAPILGYSETYGKWVSVELSAESKRQLWIPEGFAHGFLVLSKSAEFIYKTTDYYAPDYERCIKWDDLKLAIDWPIAGKPIVSEKDAEGMSLTNAELFE